MTVVLDNSRRKQICRLYFNHPRKKYIGLINEEGERERIEINSIDDIYKYAEQLKTTAQRHDAPTVPENSEQI